jgi:putative FmdB family regulatory protein
MPIYEYECTACSHRFESIQKMSDDPLIDCPECQEAALKKLISAAAFRLKGGGWYETDFKGGSKSTAESTKSKPEKATKSGSEKTT